jgi:hypothetical protein
VSTDGEATYRLRGRVLDSKFLGFPWGEELENWRIESLVELERGIGRHVVRFVEVAGAYYALKELPDEIASREYRLLGHLEGTSVPAVQPIAIVRERRTGDDTPLPAILITRYLEYSLPFRTVLGRGVLDEPEELLLDALAGLLVRLHLTGFFWGDCSLSNALFRRDAGALAAYVVDVETGELQEQLSDGQRRYDLDIAYENLSYEFLDVASEFGWDESRDPVGLAGAVIETYRQLWSELTDEEVFDTQEAAAAAERARLRGRGDRAGSHHDRLPPAASRDAGGAGPSSPPAPAAHGPRRPGESGAQAAGRPRVFRCLARAEG